MLALDDGIALLNAGRVEAAEAVFRPLLDSGPVAHYLLGLSLLTQGRYAEAWPHWESRPGRLRELRRLPIPEWTGGRIDGRTLLVLGEQGLGDELQFARFVPALRALGPRQIILACNDPNVRALGQVGADLVCSRIRTRLDEIPAPDAWVVMGSLAHRLGITLENLPARPYLRAEAKGPPGVGLVARGMSAHANDAHRSMSADLLQAAVPEGAPLTPAGDVQDSLDRVAGLDLLITVDTSWAHMAGALGVPCWVLLPAHACDWRWLQERADSPWYPSLRLFRQTVSGDWSSVLREVREALDAGRQAPPLASSPHAV
jgi:hypothetical protein